MENSGVPSEDNENTDELIIKIAALMDLEIDENDILTSHRLLAPRPSASIAVRDPALKFPKVIVKFVKRDYKELFYSGRKHLVNKTTQDI